MKLKELLYDEFKNFGKYERIFFPLIIVFILVISLLTNGSKIALISAVCGISYTILAGKGRVSCYYIGLIGTVCYSYLSFINSFYANLALYALYYFPMQIIGIFLWQKHFKKQTREIEKTNLSIQSRFKYGVLAILFSCILTVILQYTGDKNPVADAFTCVLSIFGLFLTVKRCIEQWYIWLIVNLLSFIMWLIAFLNGSNCLSTVLMWFVYTVLSVYFLYSWKKESKNDIV